jgi:hypothetical protein
MKKKRVKGETANPVNVLHLMEKIGVTKAAKEVGTSTTTLHKARQNGIVSKTVEVAAGAVLEHLGDVSTSAAPRAVAASPTITQPITPKAQRAAVTEEATTLVLMEIPLKNEAMARTIAESMLQAKKIVFTN